MNLALKHHANHIEKCNHKLNRFQININGLPPDGAKPCSCCGCPFYAHWYLFCSEDGVPFRDLGADYYNSFSWEHKTTATWKDCKLSVRHLIFLHIRLTYSPPDSAHRKTGYLVIPGCGGCFYNKSSLKLDICEMTLGYYIKNTCRCKELFCLSFHEG